MLGTINRAPKTLIALAALVLCLFPLLFAGQFAGDAEIHLVYGANAAEGRFFEFNPGERTAGVTSPGYMVLLAAIFQVVPEAAVPYAVKVLGYLAWYVGLLLLYFVSRDLLANRRLAFIVTIVAGLIPGSAYSAVVGMENGLFSAIVLTFLLAAIRWRWFEASAGPSREIVVALILGAGCWLRPEGLVLTALATGLRFLLLARPSLRTALRIVTPGALLVAFTGGSMLVFHRLETGLWLPGSGVARIIQGQATGLHLGPVALNPRVLFRLGLYAPVTIAAIVGVIAIWRDHARPHRGPWLFAGTTVAAFVVLYSSVLGSAHLGRYFVFVTPLLVLLGGAGLAAWTQTRWSAGSPSFLRRAALFGALWLGTVFAVESYARLGLVGQGALASVASTPARRAATSEAMLVRLGHPTERPVVVAQIEVQLRRYLDERFIVRSLDGRTEPDLLKFRGPGGFDHLAFLRAKGIRYILDVNNIPPSERLNLASLDASGPGETTLLGDTVFTRLGTSSTYRLDWRAGAAGDTSGRTPQ